MSKLSTALIIVLSALGVGVVGTGTYLLVSYLNRDKIGDFEAVNISNLDSVVLGDVDLGQLNPSESINQRFRVSSKIPEKVELNISFSMDKESVLDKYLNVDVKIDENSIGSGVLSELIAGEAVMKYELAASETKDVLFTYTMADADDIPIDAELDFKINFQAHSIPLFSR